MTARKVVLCPAAHIDAQTNFARTVQQGKPLSELPQNAVEDLPDSARQDASATQLRAWGVSMRHLSNWKKIHRNDLLLFARDKAVFGYALCLGTVDSPEISNALWSSQDWRLVILLAPPQLIDIPVAKLSAAIGYSPKFNVQRFAVLREDQSALALDALKKLGVKMNASLI